MKTVRIGAATYNVGELAMGHSEDDMEHVQRIGQFAIVDRLFHDPAYKKKLEKLMSGLLICECNYNFPLQGRVYVAFGDVFEPIQPGDQPHVYDVQVADNGDLVFKKVPPVADEIRDLKQQLEITKRALDRVIANADLSQAAYLNGAEHEAVQAVYALRVEYAKLRNR